MKQVIIRTDECDAPGEVYEIIVRDGQGRTIHIGYGYGPPVYVRIDREIRVPSAPGSTPDRRAGAAKGTS